jgi:RecB family endonuclease NucS
MEAYNDGSYYGKVDYRFSEKAILALIGHPLVYWEDTPNIRLEIVKGEPELLVKKEKSGRLTLEFSPKISESQNIPNIKETPTRIKVIEITPEHRPIADILGRDNQLNVPIIAQKQVSAAINAVCGIHRQRPF